MTGGVALRGGVDGETLRSMVAVPIYSLVQFLTRANANPQRREAAPVSDVHRQAREGGRPLCRAAGWQGKQV